MQIADGLHKAFVFTVQSNVQKFKNLNNSMIEIV